MMKWLGFLLVLGVVAAVGCSKGPSASQREVKDAGEAGVDAAQEKAAMKGTGGPSPASSRP